MPRCRDHAAWSLYFTLFHCVCRVCVPGGGQDVFGNTPLINLAKKNAMTSRFTLGQRLEAAVYLIEKGARVNHKNREGLCALTIAVRDRESRSSLEIRA